MTIQILNCSCNHEFQDKQYGKGRRVHNTIVKEGKARCTVCKAENNVLKKEGGGIRND